MEVIVDWLQFNSRRVLSWFKDDVFRRLFVNAGKLLSANAVSAVLQFLVTLLAARALGPEKYGIFSLVLIYELTIGKLVAFEAWQAVIKFGSEALEREDRQALRQLIKFTFCLDIGSAVVGTVFAMALAGPVITLLGWDPSVRSLLVLYSVLILFTLNGTPVGLLRLFDRFDLLSYTAVLSAVIRLVSVVWCVLSKQDLLGYVLVYVITGIAGQLYQVGASVWVLRKQGVGNVVREPLRGILTKFPGIWDYVWTTNLTMTVRMLSREADGLFIAGLTTPAALGLFNVAKQFSSVLPKLSGPLSQSIYPELARSWVKGDRRLFASLIKRTTLFTSAAALLGWFAFVLLGRWIIRLTVGPAFQGAYWVAVFYLLAMVVFLCSFTLTPSLLAMGLARRSFFANLAATMLYFCLLFPLVKAFGITGASLAYVGFFLVWSAIMVGCLLATLRGRPQCGDDVVERR
ncbi:MAG: oligosaccharide flippase family protein [Phycisphaerales bacterium]